MFSYNNACKKRTFTGCLYYINAILKSFDTANLTTETFYTLEWYHFIKLNIRLSKDVT